MKEYGRFKAGNQQLVDKDVCFLCNEQFTLDESIDLMPYKQVDGEQFLHEAKLVHTGCYKTFDRINSGEV